MPCSGQIRISQVYGGGGNSGSTFTHDFIELLNAGGTPVDLAGWSVQYASATGSTWQSTSLAGTIQPMQYYLVQEAPGGGGTASLPVPDVIGVIPMSASAGKVALVCSVAVAAGACPLGPLVVDFVGFGPNANCFEGASPAPAPNSSNAIHRQEGGSMDTDDNKADFATGAPVPRNTSSPPFTLSVGGGGAVPAGSEPTLYAFPNPFNPSTRIRYNVPRAGLVRIAVLDILGRHMFTVVDRRHDAGGHEVLFDGSGLSSGAYLCVMQTGGRVRVHVMMLVR
ncbi:MAG: lamin tail domain-containing protein [Bacteroidetes bacterium]|nr:lamin tail domain-containing protein [Bacteroidota bacterium]